MAKVTLTDRKIKSLKPAPKGERYQEMDGLVPGFGVRVTDKGLKTYILHKRFPGSTNPVRREIGKCSVLDLDEAREIARDWLKQIKRGIDPAIALQEEREENIKKKNNTFGSVADDWFVEVLRKQRTGKPTEKQVLDNFVWRDGDRKVPLWRDRPITEITDLDILRIINATKRRGVPVMARQLLSHAKRFFSWAFEQREYGLQINPCLTINTKKLLGKKVKRQRVLNDDEMFALWRNVRRTPYPFGPVYQLLVLTALRLNEPAGAKKAEVDFRNGVWTIPAERMKGREGEAAPHEVPLIDEIRAVFESLPTFQEGPHLFSVDFGKSPVWMTSKAKNRLDARMLRTLRALAKHRGENPDEVELPPFVNHDIRRSVRTRLTQKRVGVAPHVAEAILAHTLGGIEGVYDVNGYAEEKRDALKRWAVELQRISGIEPQRGKVIKLRG